MPLALKRYVTDTGKEYAFLPVSLSIRDSNNESITPDANFIDFLPSNYQSLYLDSQFICQESNIVPRRLRLYLNGSPSINFTFSFSFPFNELLFVSLSNDSRIKAFEFIGERIKPTKLETIV